MSKPQTYIKKHSLTDLQIGEILDRLPLPSGYGLSARKQAMHDIRIMLTDKLSKVKLVDDPDAFARFSDTIYNTFVANSMDSWAPIGINASMSISAPITQSSLNSFHAAGAESGISEFFKLLRSYLAVTQTNSLAANIVIPQSRVNKSISTDMDTVKHLNDIKSTYREFRGVIEETIMPSIIASFDFINGNGDAEWAETWLNYREQFDIASDTRQYNMDKILRVNLDLGRMFSHKILIGDVIEAWDMKVHPDEARQIQLVWGPTYKGIIYAVFYRDITPNMDLEGMSDSHVSSVFSNLMGVMRRDTTVEVAKRQYRHPILIKGMSGITAMRVDTRPIAGIMREYVVDEDDPFTHRIYISSQQTRLGGPSLRDLHFLVKYDHVPIAINTDRNTIPWKDVKYVIVDTETLMNMIAEGGITYEVFSSDRWMVKRIAADYEWDKWLDVIRAAYVPNSLVKRVAIDSAERCLVIEVTKKSANIAEAVRKSKLDESSIVRINCKGNFNSILKYSGFDILIDLYRSYPLYHGDVNTNQGLQNTVFFMINEFHRNIVSTGSSLNIRHLELIFSYMASEGILNPLNFYGVRRLNDVLTAASHQRAVPVIGSACFEGTVDKADKVSTTIYIGKKIKQGTGAVRVEQGDYNNFVGNALDFTFDGTLAGKNYAEVPFFETDAPTLSRVSSTATRDLAPIIELEQQQLYAGISGEVDPDFDIVF